MKIFKGAKRLWVIGLAKIKSIIQPVYPIGDVDTTLVIDRNNGDVQSMTFIGDTTITIINWPASGNMSVLKLWITDGGDHSLTWPDSLDPSLTISGTDIFVMTTIDDGNNIAGAIAMSNI